MGSVTFTKVIIVMQSMSSSRSDSFLEIGLRGSLVSGRSIILLQPGADTYQKEVKAHLQGPNIYRDSATSPDRYRDASLCID